MSFDAFIKLDGIEGEETDDKHSNWIRLLNYGIGATMSEVNMAPGGASAGRPNLQDFHFTHFLDKASPKLFEHVCTGKHIDKVTVEICRSGESKSKYMEYVMEDVMVTSVGRGGEAADRHEWPLEAVTLNYAKIKMSYTVQRRKGAAGAGTVDFGWDRLKNKTA
jgi:type VI secretion system secreted protein Hcp